MTDPPKDAPQGTGKSERISEKYDPRYHNAYRLYDEKEDINQYHIHLELTGRETDDNSNVAAKLFQFKAMKRKSFLEQARQTKDAKSWKTETISPSTACFQGRLKIEKSGSGCGTYTFTYGDKYDGDRAFRFRSDDKSVLKDGRNMVTEDAPSALRGQYCVPKPMEETVQTVAGDGKGKAKDVKVRSGTRLECSFPGWYKICF